MTVGELIKVLSELPTDYEVTYAYDTRVCVGVRVRQIEVDREDRQVILFDDKRTDYESDDPRYKPEDFEYGDVIWTAPDDT